MGWYVWAIAWVVLSGGGWWGNRFRHAMRTRHERKVELISAEGEKQRALQAANRPPEAICGCTHHLAKHDKQGKCHEVVQAPTAWDAEKKPVSYEARPCNCQQYIGPRPLETLYAEDIVDLS
ncbi:hypothetical protein M2266_003305 [Streptomyces sp. SPB162]|nr:hypothetical protein [Streptomyces sp. SPB162]